MNASDYEALINASVATLRTNLPPNTGLAVIGTTSAILSCLIMWTIYKNPSLRSKYYTNMLHLAFADILMGLVHACIGYKSITLLLTGSNEVSTPLRCAVDIEFIKMSQLSSGTQTIVLAIDRLIAVSFPLWYMQSGDLYNHLMHAGFWALAFALPLIQATGVQQREVIANCLYAQTIQEWATYMMNRIQLTILSATIASYGVTAIVGVGRIAAARRGKGYGVNAKLSANQASKQRRITMVCFLVGGTLVISQGIGLVWSNILLPLPIEIRNFLAPWPGAILQLAGIVNFLLYWFLDRDFRRGVVQVSGGVASSSVVLPSGPLSKLDQTSHA